MRPRLPSWIRSRKGIAAPAVALGDRDDQAQVGLDQLALGLHVAALDALGQRDLSHGGEERHLADLFKVHAHRVVGGRLHGEVERGDALLLLLLSGRLDTWPSLSGALVALDDVDAEVVEEDEDVVDLLGGQLDVLSVSCTCSAFR